MTRIYISRDSGALCVGAEAVAEKFRKEAKERGLDVEIVRTGSRGMYWLEPLVEVETAQGRVGYGPVKASKVGDLIDAGMLDGKPHTKLYRRRRRLSLVQEPDPPHLRPLRHRRSPLHRGLPSA